VERGPKPRAAIARIFAVVFGLLALAACAGTGPNRPIAAERIANAWVQDELRPFSGEQELRDYLRDVRRAAAARGDEGVIVVTGSRIPARNVSITNVQEAGVDEGDVVKQIGRFLIVLQDGRLFSIDTGAGAGSDLSLADRVNVYRAVGGREEYEQDWYDELLVRGDRIVVTGYSYRRDASELNVFRLTADGRFEREGIFQIDSDDYYDRDNYATRLIGDNIVIYTPFSIRASGGRGGASFPRVRRIEPGPGGDRNGPARALLDVRSLYGPLAHTIAPTIHSVSVCPLGAATAGRDLRCRTRAFIGPDRRRFYVSPTHVYLWIGPDSDAPWHSRWDNDCPPGHRAGVDEAERAFVYRIPVGIGDPQAVAVRGVPSDQFSLDEAAGEFRALLQWRSARCHAAEGDPYQLSYFSIPLSRFSTRVSEAPAASFVALPPVWRREVANRFTETYLAYAPVREARQIDSDDPDEDARYEPVPTRLIVVPVGHPQRPVSIPLAHNVSRLEVAGSNLLAAGYPADADAGSRLSLIDLSQAPRVASTLQLERRYDGEGRSHAFNLLLGADGAGMFGLPTIPHVEEQSQDAWWSLPSDISFFSLDAAGTIRPIGILASSLPRYRGGDDQDAELLDGEPDADAIAGYSCEVSCVDWYGNSRPIFSGGRIFALSATELIEGRLESGRIVEVRRLDFVRTRPR
jgi:hypothetical protein